MNTKYLPYYISRALLSGVMAVIIMGLNWKALLLGAAFFSVFLLYLHSGWFRVDPDHGLFPLRRDTRGQLIQRKALIMAVLFGLVTYLILSIVSTRLDLSLVSGFLALASAVIAYFATQFVLFKRA